MIKNKLISQVLCVLIYAFAFGLSYLLIPEKLIDLVQKGEIHFWLLILIAHIIATIIIYLFSVILKNSSLYDPFWSVAPVPIVIILSMGMETLEIKLLVLIPICFWALRLTRNWIISWEGFEHEDFRYIDLKNTSMFKAEFNNFFGIHLFPTLIVNLSLYPLVFILTNNSNSSIFLSFASLFTFLAVVLETISDEQMREFRKNPLNKGKTMKYKLWKYSRHPNYLGEIGFWFGIYMMGLSSGMAPFWIIICPLTMLALFIFVSCPMMDNRSLMNRPDYKDYMEVTSQLMLLPPKK